MDDDLPNITDEEMRAGLAGTREYTVVLLRATGVERTPEVEATIWEHGRRNFALRQRGTLAIVCPIADDSPWAGLGLFTTDPAETARIMDADPGVQAGIFTYEVHSARSFPGDALPG